jgi:hypothetical protein
VQQLVSRIIEYGILEVSAQTRLDILTKTRDNAGNNYFRAWLENVSAMDVTREWLKAGASASADNPVLETVMPLLHVCFLCLYFLSMCLIIFLAFIFLLAVMPLNDPARFRDHRLDCGPLAFYGRDARLLQNWQNCAQAR